MTTTTPTNTVDRLLGPVLRHADRWAPVCLGAVFWGSVLFATGRRLWPDTATPVLLLTAVAIGLTGGLAARRRGYWL